jgi:hypothetical protein
MDRSSLLWTSANTVSVACFCWLGLLLAATPGCTPSGNLANSPPAFSLAFKGKDDMNLHVRWSSDGMTWQDPHTFRAGTATDSGPGQGGIPEGLSQLMVFRRGTELFQLSAIGPSEYGTSGPEVVENNVSVDSAPSVAFTGNGNWLIAHRSNNDGVLKLWNHTSPPAVITPAGTMLGLCNSDNVSGPIGPKVMVLNNLVLAAFCLDSGGTETINLLPGTINAQGTPSFGSQVQFTNQEPGFDAPHAKVFALGHDGTNFLLASVAPNSVQSGQLTTFGLMIYRSTNGQNWNLVTLTSTSSGLNLSALSSPLGVAAIPPRNNNPAFIEVAQLAGNASPPRLWAFDGNAWSDLTNNNAFGASAVDTTQEFSFRVNGRP